MKEETKQWMLGVVVGVVATSLIAIGLSKMPQPPEPSAVTMPKDIIEAYNMGLKDALKLNPVSLELDQACLTLWANKQPMEIFK